MTKIWPECLETAGERRRRRHAMYMLMGESWDEALACVRAEDAEQNWRESKIVFSIAQGRVKDAQPERWR